MSSGLFKNVIDKMYSEIIYLIYMYKKDLALNNQQWLICHKTKPNHIHPEVETSLNQVGQPQNLTFMMKEENVQPPPTICTVVISIKNKTGNPIYVDILYKLNNQKLETATY